MKLVNAKRHMPISLNQLLITNENVPFEYTRNKSNSKKWPTNHRHCLGMLINYKIVYL